MRKVKEFLAETLLLVPEIAQRTGFRHAEYLSVAFKRYAGMTLSEYRREPARDRHQAPARPEKLILLIVFLIDKDPCKGLD